MVDQAEDQLTFASGIGSADKALDIGALHQLLQDLVLLLRTGRDLVKPFLRQDRQILQPPFDIAFIVAFRG